MITTHKSKEKPDVRLPGYAPSRSLPLTSMHYFSLHTATDMHNELGLLLFRVRDTNQSTNLLGNKGPKARPTYKSQYAVYNDYSARQCIQYIKKSCIGKRQFTNYVKFSLE